MGVRPNIQSAAIEGAELVVRGESDTPLPHIVQVLVVQGTKTEDARGEVEVAVGQPKEISTGWRARLDAEGFERGESAEALGVEIRISPFEVTSWFQVVEIK